MIILALDSSAVTATVALAQDSGDNSRLRLLGLNTINGALTHSEMLLPMVDSMLRGLALHIDDVDLFACSAGPGSFTGVRIGVSMIKGLAFPKNKPCVGVSTLEALAYNLHGCDGIVCPVMDARRSQLYNAVFKDGRRLTDDRLISPDELKDELMAYDGETIHFVGDGYQIAKRMVELPSIADTTELLSYQNAFSVAMAAHKKFLNGESVACDELLPVYLRASQAEREREKRLAEQNK